MLTSVYHFPLQPRSRTTLLTGTDELARFAFTVFRAFWLTAGSLTEILFDEATKQANELDEYFKKHGRLVGPLHGICMTLKDQFDVEGFDSTLGYVGRSHRPAMQDCVLVTILKRLGAVVVAKSNLPQSIMVRHRHNSFRSGPAYSV